MYLMVNLIFEFEKDNISFEENEKVLKIVIGGR